MNPWWHRDGLEVRDHRLLFGGHDAERIAREHGIDLEYEVELWSSK